MKIKTKQKLNLPELIQHVWENEVYPCRYINNFNGEVIFNDTGKFMTDESFISPNSYFTVEVEEELTEETLIIGMTGVYYDRQRKELDLTVMQRTAIKYQLGDDVDDILLAIYVGPTLIWSRESGIPETGVLEVDAE